MARDDKEQEDEVVVVGGGDAFAVVFVVIDVGVADTRSKGELIR